jgi:hypothetical protein
MGVAGGAAAGSGETVGITEAVAKVLGVATDDGLSNSAGMSLPAEATTRGRAGLGLGSGMIFAEIAVTAAGFFVSPAPGLRDVLASGLEPGLASGFLDAVALAFGSGFFVAADARSA